MKGCLFDMSSGLLTWATSSQQGLQILETQKQPCVDSKSLDCERRDLVMLTFAGSCLMPRPTSFSDFWSTPVFEPARAGAHCRGCYSWTVSTSAGLQLGITQCTSFLASIKGHLLHCRVSQWLRRPARNRVTQPSTCCSD
jgi:hypothetical protein